jgi:hypothetical protein
MKRRTNVLLCLALLLTFSAVDSVRSQGLVLYLNENGALTLDPYPALPPGTVGGELQAITHSFSWTYDVQETVQGSAYIFDIIAGSIHPQGCDLQASFIRLRSGSETVLASTGSFHAPLAGFTTFGYMSPARVQKLFPAPDTTAVAGDQLIFRVTDVAGGSTGFLDLREAKMGPSSVRVSNSSLTPVNMNGGFEGGTPGEKSWRDIPGWELSLTAPASATFSIVDNPTIEGNRALNVAVTALGSNPWDIQVVNDSIPVEKSTDYFFSVWARADKDGPVVNFTAGDPAYNEWGREGQVVMTKAWQYITFSFKTSATATLGRAPIHFGESANSTYLPVTFYIDDLQITKIGIPVGTVPGLHQIPAVFSLDQNYPNPFNPATTIRYALPQRSQVTLSVFNTLGQLVSTLANEGEQAGYHEVKFDGSNLPSGVYFYRLQAGSLVQTRKLLLIR